MYLMVLGWKFTRLYYFFEKRATNVSSSLFVYGFVFSFRLPFFLYPAGLFLGITRLLAVLLLALRHTVILQAPVVDQVLHVTLP